MSQPSLSYHFRTKDELWRAAVDRLFALLDEALVSRAAGLRGVDRLTTAKLIVREFIVFSAAHPELHRIITLESKGEGEIYSYSLMRKSAAGPYAIGYVTLDEGPSLLTNFTDCELESLKIGQRVKVVFKPTDGAPLPFFTPVK